MLAHTLAHTVVGGRGKRGKIKIPLLYSMDMLLVYVQFSSEYFIATFMFNSVYYLNLVGLGC